jgi:hypothetical protein
MTPDAFRVGPGQKGSVLMLHTGDWSPLVGNARSGDGLSAMFRPVTPFGPGSATRAVTLATTRPESPSSLRSSRTMLSSSMIPSSMRLRKFWLAPSEPPSVDGMSQRLCGPPGPLKEPRLSMSHGPVKSRRCGMPYGLL